MNAKAILSKLKTWAAKFNPDQERDERGRFASGGGSGSGDKGPTVTKELRSQIRAMSEASAKEARHDDPHSLGRMQGHDMGVDIIGRAKTTDEALRKI
jgi:hypothetical protein